MNQTSRLLASLLTLSLCVGCPSEDDPEPDMSTSDTAVDDDDAGTAGDDSGSPGGGDMAPAADSWTHLYIEDQTRPGEGLPVDAVEVCLLDGSSCVPMTVVAASSDDGLDYSGLQDGPTAQDDSCTETSFTELGAGNWVILGFEDTEETIVPSSKINVWIGSSDCSLIPPGEKPFTIKIGNSTTPADFLEAGQCGGTCTVSPPS